MTKVRPGVDAEAGSDARIVAETATGPLYLGTTSLTYLPLQVAFDLLREFAWGSLSSKYPVRSSVAKRLTRRGKRAAYHDYAANLMGTFVVGGPLYQRAFLKQLLHAVDRHGGATGFESLLTTAVQSMWLNGDTEGAAWALAAWQRTVPKAAFAWRNYVVAYDEGSRTLKTFGPGELPALSMETAILELQKMKERPGAGGRSGAGGWQGYPGGPQGGLGGWQGGPGGSNGGSWHGGPGGVPGGIPGGGPGGGAGVDPGGWWQGGPGGAGGWQGGGWPGGGPGGGIGGGIGGWPGGGAGGGPGGWQGGPGGVPGGAQGGAGGWQQDLGGFGPSGVMPGGPFAQGFGGGSYNPSHVSSGSGRGELGKAIGTTMQHVGGGYIAIGVAGVIGSGASAGLTGALGVAFIGMGAALVGTGTYVNGLSEKAIRDAEKQEADRPVKDPPPAEDNGEIIELDDEPIDLDDDGSKPNPEDHKPNPNDYYPDPNGSSPGTPHSIPGIGDYFSKPDPNDGGGSPVSRLVTQGRATLVSGPGLQAFFVDKGNGAVTALEPVKFNDDGSLRSPGALRVL